ncbi:hypothetical protein [Pedobacter sp. Leaf250]|uniref:hypothetical protein n=1 Tax=Pedobacter sp. Leaf250 TaxID=2876559 RepID=UPI001E490C98|nr:hypothetical protein [Pedobacter sp. Leaf250]
MTLETEDKATRIAKELKSIISQFSYRSFIAHMAHLSTAHHRQGTGVIKLRSPIRQLMYLVSLYHATPQRGTKRYSAIGTDERRIIKLLNEIEREYGYAPTNAQSKLSKEDVDKIIVTKSTFLNYYLNAPLSFFEQDIERITRTFRHLEPFIFQETGFKIQDFIDFFQLLTRLEKKYMELYANNDFDGNPTIAALNRGRPAKQLSIDEKLHLLDLGENRIYKMGIPFSDIYSEIDKEKAEQLLAHFTLLGKEDADYLYYTDDCPYLDRPILLMDGDHIVMLYSKQLINAIYNFLYRICNVPEAPGRKISERRDEFLEEKTREVFQDFFGSEAKVYTSYYCNGNEKDRLILCNRQVFVIECKAHKYHEPLRDTERAYQRIKSDFKKIIGKGFSQAIEVEDVLLDDKPFDICGKNKKATETIQPEDFDEIFTIVVTQERFGQIQCNLGHLLNIDDDRNYPWSVSIDDLESFLITLKRKDDYVAEFGRFLLAREKLHGRLYCYDELELCAYFLFDRDKFVKDCAKKAPFFSSPDMNKCFDLLYRVGFGFKNEQNFDDKENRYDLEAHHFTRYHKLKPVKKTEV